MIALDSTSGGERKKYCAAKEHNRCGQHGVWTGANHIEGHGRGNEAL